MAKPKSPLLSLGARGSIGDTLTFQKRGRLTIARQKPIPTDPKTDLQLAQRQVYREAVAAWNAMSTEDKEAYRGVCPGLTPYQCYMKTALLPPEPEPEPEEHTEEQTQYNAQFLCYHLGWEKVGQKLIIPNRTITKLGFWLSRLSAPSGQTFFEIRRVLGDVLIVSKLWGNSDDLTGTPTYYELEFDTPPTIDEEVRAVVRVTSGDDDHAVEISYWNENVKDDEEFTRYSSTTHNWADVDIFDIAYIYTYKE